MKRYPRVLTIAGSDSGGGAGIQADLKTFMACKCYGMSALTAITAQNTIGVTAIHALPTDMIAQQIDAVMSDIGADGIKIGMLHSVEVIECVATSLQQHQKCPVVLDPVMVATSGARLIEDDAIEAMRELLFPLVTMITPNIPEAEVLLGASIDLEAGLESAAATLGEKMAAGVLLKGGHLDTALVTDVYFADGAVTRFSNKRVVTNNTHGTGCTLSSAIAAFLARGCAVEQAIEQAKEYLHGALSAGAEYTTGGGCGPVNHGFRL